MLTENTTVEELVEKFTTSEHPLPPYMASGLAYYVIFGTPPGSFLTAVLANDLMEAMGRADLENRQLLFNYTFNLYNYAIPQCYGSHATVTKWQQMGGWKGFLLDAEVERGR